MRVRVRVRVGAARRSEAAAQALRPLDEAL